MFDIIRLDSDALLHFLKQGYAISFLDFITRFHPPMGLTMHQTGNALSSSGQLTNTMRQLMVRFLHSEFVTITVSMAFINVALDAAEPSLGEACSFSLNNKHGPVLLP